MFSFLGRSFLGSSFLGSPMWGFELVESSLKPQLVNQDQNKNHGLSAPQAIFGHKGLIYGRGASSTLSLVSLRSSSGLGWLH